MKDKDMDEAAIDLLIGEAFAADPGELTLPELAEDEARALAAIDIEALVAPAAKAEGAGPAAVVPSPALASRITMRCVYCKDALERDAAVYCASCLAQHHADCFAEHGACSILDCPETRVLRPEELPKKRRRSRGRLFIGLALGLTTLGGVAAWNAAGPKLLEEPGELLTMTAPGVVSQQGPAPASVRVALGPTAPERSEKAIVTLGGPEGTFSVVPARLAWLMRHQSPEGYWDSDGWSAQCLEDACAGPGYERGDPRLDVGVTALATLAFLGNGHSHRFGAFKRSVAKSLRWLREQQRGDGSIGIPGIERGEVFDREMLNHALATMALCEAYAISRDFKLQKYARRAVDFGLAAQNPDGGWGYGLRSGGSDSLVTAWMVLALKAAKTAGLKPPQAAFQGALRWYRSVTTRDGRVGYAAPGEGAASIDGRSALHEARPTMTAAGVIARIMAGEAKDSLANRKGAAILDGDTARWLRGSEPEVDFLYGYFGSYALFHFGGEPWKRWRSEVRPELKKRARQGGCADGAWDPIGAQCPLGGRVYATAINSLTLGLFDRDDRRQ